MIFTILYIASSDQIKHYNKIIELILTLQNANLSYLNITHLIKLFSLFSKFSLNIFLHPF